MEALYIRQPSEEKAEDGVMMMEGGEGEREKSKAHEEEGTEASYFKVSSSDEEMDEDSEPEPPPPVNRKKVAFADALGLDLVTVMEFEAPEIEVSEVIQPPGSNASHTVEEIYYMSCLFTVQSSEEELDQRLREQSVELESIELLPGTTTLRGTVTVVNLCYGKSVHVRMTLDCWASYFELCAEYVPGSSDKKTDRFAFKYTMVPPFEKEGSRLEFCLRYETSVGTFWANNKGMNYVLFCHRKQHVKEQVEQESSYKSRGSCLKSSRRRKSWENSNTARFIAEEEARHRAEEAGIKSEDRAETLLYPDKRRPSAASIKSRLRATRLASVLLSQKRQQVPQVDQPLPAPWRDSASCLYEQQQKQPIKSVQVLTYHQIPLLTLDWNNDKSQHAADVEDIWTGRPKMTSSKASAEYIDEKPCVDDMWETFHNATDNTTDKEASVCEVWQAFLNEPSCTDHSGVPESEWLQTAASVSPSNDKEPKAQYGAGSSHVHEFQVGTDTAITSTTTYTTLHTSAACQLLSDTGGTSPDNVAMKTIERQQQPAEARVSRGPGDDIAATQDAASPQRSQTNSETDTAGECSPRGLTPVSEDSAAVDSSSVCHEHAAWEHAASGEIIGAIGRDEPGFIPHTANLVTSSGESETTDMTATPQSQNASATDRISQGARPEEALSSSRGGEVTGTLHNATDDTLAFRGTIRQGTKDGERFVFYSTSTREVKEGIMNNRTAANKVSVSAGEEEIFRPQETEECEISPRYDADEKQREEFRPNHNSGSPLRERESDGDEIRAAQQSQADEFDPNQTSKDNFKQSQITPSKFKSDESENKDDVSNDKDLAKFRKTDSEPFCCTTKDETKIVIGAEAGIIQMLNEDTRKENDKAFKLSSQGLNEQCGPNGAGEELCIREKEQGDSTLTQTQEHVALKCETGEEQQPSSPRTSHTEESWEMTKKDFRSSDRDPFRPFPTDKCNRKPSKAVERRWSHSRDDIMKGHEEDVGGEISAGEEVFTAGENVAERSTPTELQKQPEILERTEEDMSHKDRDERVSIGKMKIDAPGELMMGSLENPQGERENAPAQLRERELSAAVESPPRVVECEKLSEGTEDAITAESTGALGVIESGLVERFGEDLVMGIWKDLFGGRVKASHRDTNIVGLMEGALSDRPDVTLDRNLLAETAFDDAFDSGVFSLIELPDTDTNPCLCQGLQQQQPLASESNERSPRQRSQSPITGQETDCFSEPQTHSNSSAHFSGGLDPVLVDQGRPLLAVSGKSSPGDEENYTQIKQRSVTHQEPDRQIEDCVVIPHKKESLNPSASHKHSSSPSEKSKESGGFAWWTLFYILGHVTRLVICGLLVTGFFFIVYLYDFPLFLALYMFSLCWWFSKWKSHRAATTDKSTLPGKA